MRKALLVLASLAAIAFAGCASSGSNPWATPDSKPVPRAYASAPAAATTATPSDALFADDPEYVPAAPSDAVPVEQSVVPGAPDDILAEFPAIRKANLEKALRALKSASAVEELPMPDKGNARITRYNAQFGVIEFITPDEYAVGDHVVLTKENKSALVTVIEVEGDRFVADLNAGVKGAPELNASDHVLCSVYRTQEELAAIAAAQRKAQREALAAARAAMEQERAALGEGGMDDDSAAEDEDSGDEEASDDDFGDDESFDDEDW